MSRTPRSVFKKVGAALALAVLGVCASLVVATPALAADQKTYGNLTFSSDDPLTGIMFDGKGEVVITGTSDIIVTQATEPDGPNVTSIVIGGEDEDDYSGSLVFNTVTLNPVAIQITSADVAFANCTLTGGASGPTIVSVGESAITFSGTTTLAGGAGASGASPTEGTAALRATDKTAINVSGTMSATGGAGGNLDATQGTPTSGGAGIYAPDATLSMESGKLTVKAGDTYTATADSTPAVLPVGLTIGVFDLSNGTGTPGKGPEVTAIGWPTANAKPLPVDGFDAGSAADETFYPWLLQVSQSLDGSDPYLINFAGSGMTDPIEREGWRWFNIAPHPVTGLEVAPVFGVDEPEDAITNVLNPLPGLELAAEYSLGITPSFSDLDDLSIFGWIDGSGLENPTVTPAGAVEWTSEADTFTLASGFTSSSITFSGTATLPKSLTDLYPELSTSVSTAIPVTGAKAVYRLYNPNGGLHLYTTDVNEVTTLVELGWSNEGPLWLEPATASAGDSLIVRLYNPNNGDHYYVPEADTGQIAVLTGLGWRNEGTAAGFISLPKADGLAVTTLFNPNVTQGTHLWTPSTNEVLVLTGLGWKNQGADIYALPFVMQS